jgi:Calx-beta domain
VEAIGDNTNDAGETVTATVTGGGTTYIVGSPGDSGTVTIADQATTVSVAALNDGAEGGTNPMIRITRSGDISGSLSVGYTLSGTAMSGTDYTAPSGSVSFSANETYKDVTISLDDDTTAESTETITLTLDPPSGNYTLGNESDTVFVKDNERNRVVWKGGNSAGPNDWNIAANWTSNAVPTADDDVYFDGDLFNTHYCYNVGSSLSSPLYGMHIINGFSPLLILDKSLTVINYEQQSAILNQPSARDLTVTGTMLWTGGTLDATASGASVNISGAAARFDGPDIGSMFTSSWLRVVNGANLAVEPGVINFTAGKGLLLQDAKMKWKGSNARLAFERPEVGSDAEIKIASGGDMAAVKKNANSPGSIDTIPIRNEGSVLIQDGVQLNIGGRAPGAATNPSYYQSGLTSYISITTGAAIKTQFGIGIYDGYVNINVDKQNVYVNIVGDVHIDAKVISFSGESDPAPNTNKPSGQLTVQGEINWVGGIYVPNIKKNSSPTASNIYATRKITIGDNARISPSVFNISNPNWALGSWKIIESEVEIVGSRQGRLINNHDNLLLDPLLFGDVATIWRLKK